MKVGKIYRVTYIVVEIFLIIIYLIQIPVVLQSKIGPLILIDYTLGAIETIGGLYVITKFSQTGKIKYLTIASYLPLLILIEKGIVRILGAALIALATVAKYLAIKNEEKKIT